MGDARFSPAYDTIRDSPNRVVSIRQFSDEEVIAALGGASQEGDALVANFLATEAMNRTLLGRAILESMPDALIACDREGPVTFMNSAAEMMLGHLREDRIGRDITEFLTASKGTDAESLGALLMSPLTAGEPGQHDDVTFSIDGAEPLHARVSTAPLMIHDVIRGVVLRFERRPSGRPKERTVWAERRS